jgi:hypothetical protein
MESLSLHLWIDLLTAFYFLKNDRWMIEDFDGPVSLRGTAKHGAISRGE